jgi:poly(3-hydroxyalkanoate) synthetase
MGVFAELVRGRSAARRTVRRHSCASLVVTASKVSRRSTIPIQSPSDERPILPLDAPTPPSGVVPAETWLIVGPYAVHDAAIADFAEGHSLAGALTEEGAGPLALTFWKSATVQMRDYGIDAYLSDLNVAVDDLGGRVSLVGICQGGWLAAAYAARFPRKVEKLVATAAPLDPGAAESHITRTLAATPPAAIARALALTGGRVSGTMSSALFGDNWWPEFNAEAALQGADVSTVQRFDVWNSRTVDLPGVYFAQTAEWIFRQNRLANGVVRQRARSASHRGSFRP